VLPFDASAPLRILMLGRIVPHKRIEHGIHILADLRQRGFDVQLDVVGSCHNAVYAGFLQDQAQSRGVTDSVHMWGMLSDADVAERFAQASALLVTSEHEGFCIPVLEAMHLGVPAVVREGSAATEVGGAATPVFADPAQGAECLAQLLSQPALRRERVKLGFDRSSALMREASIDTWMALLDRL
jgi:glycosyltransferase involved in cell wall biosynthesis